MRLGIRKGILISMFAIGIIMSGCGADSVTGESDSSLKNGVQTQKQLQSEETNTEMTGRYVEENASLPQKGSQGQAMAITEDGSIVWFDGKSTLFTANVEKLFSQKEDVWEKKKEFVIDPDAYVLNSAIAEDGSLAYIDMGSFGDNPKVTLQIVDASQKEYVVEGNFSDGDYIWRLFWKEPGKLYGLSVRGRVCQINLESKMLEQLFVGKSAPETLSFQNDLLFAVENNGVELFDLKNMEMQEADEVLNTFCTEEFKGLLGTSSNSVYAVLMPQEDNVLYLACGNGLYRHVLDGAAIEQIVDGQRSILGDMNTSMYDMAALADGTFVMLASGKLVRFVYDPNAVLPQGQKLNIYSLYENERIRQAVQIFIQQNPEMSVNYEVGIETDSSVTLNDAQKNLNLALMGENGPDVIILDGLDVENYLEKGVFLDLSEIAKRLKMEGKILPNIADACDTDGSVYELPTAIQIPILFGRQEDLEQIGDLADLTACVKKLREQNALGAITGNFTTEQHLAQLLSVNTDTFLEDGKVDRERLGVFLEQAKQIAQADLSGVEDVYIEMFGQHGQAESVGDKAMMIMMEQGMLGYGMAYSALMDAGMMDVFLKEDGYTMKYWTADNVSGFLPIDRVAVSATSSHPDVAEMFLDVLFSEQVQVIDFYGGFPVSQAGWENLLRERKEGDDDYICFGGTTRMPDGTTVECFADWPRVSVMEQIFEMVKQADKSIRKNIWVEQAIMEYGPKALAGVSTVEETVEMICRSVAVYLAE